MKIFDYIYVVIFLLLFAINANAQQDNLWTTEFGSRSTLVGGAVTASVRDNSAIFYNPGALGFMENSNIGLSANIATLHTTYIKNGGGEGINLYHPSFRFIPQFISGIVKLEQIPDITFTYAVFNKHESHLNFRENHTYNLDLYPQFEGKEKFHARYEYIDDLNETWFGFGAGYLLNKNWSVGMSLFFAYKSEKSVEFIENTVYDKNSDIVASSRFSEDTRMDQLGMVFKFGVAYEDEFISWGAAITSTGIPTLIFDGASLNRLEYIKLPGKKEHLYNIYNDWTDSWFKSPWEFDTGVQFVFGRGIINLRGTYFSHVSTYAITKFDDDAIVSGNFSTPLFPKRNKVMYASRAFINLALGFERRLNDNLTLLTGFKVDRNAFDSEKLDRVEYWVPTISYWNLYTATVGFDYRTEKSNNLIFGFSYRFTNRDNDTQVVNLTNPDPNNYLMGARTNTAETNINGFSLIIGYTFNFASPTKKDIRNKIDVDKLNPFNLIN